MPDKKQVLVVDDEPGIVKILSVQLKIHGYDVISTLSGIEAVELVKTQNPDLVLLDILMPDVSGLVVLEKIRTFSVVPVIILTANPRFVDNVIKLGANDFVSKPFNLDHLMEKVNSILDGSKGPLPY